MVVVQTIEAQGALRGHAGLLVNLRHLVGARVHAGAAPDAHVLIHYHSAVVLALRHGAGGTVGHASRLGAMVAQRGTEVHLHFREGARRAVQIALESFHMGPIQLAGHVVGYLAGNRAGLAAHAASRVDHHSILLSHVAPTPSLLPPARRRMPCKSGKCALLWGSTSSGSASGSCPQWCSRESSRFGWPPYRARCPR